MMLGGGTVQVGGTVLAAWRGAHQRMRGAARAPRPATASAAERGSVTAEFAVVLPAVIVVVACCLGGIRLVTVQLQLSDAASIAARILARGESLQSATTAARTVVGDVRLSRRTANPGEGGGSIVCVTATTGPSPGFLGLLAVSGSSCSLAVSTT